MSMGGGPKKAKETSEEKDLANIGMQRWQRYQEKWKGVRDQFIGDVRDGREEKSLAMSQSGANTAGKFEAKRPGLEAGLATAGGLGSGKFVGGTGKFRTDQARSGGMSLVDTRNAAEGSRLATMEALTQQGQGKAGGAISGLADVAAISSQQSIQDAEAAVANRAAWGDALMSAGGMAAGMMGGPGGGGGPETTPTNVEGAQGTPKALNANGTYVDTTSSGMSPGLTTYPYNDVQPKL
jgi:hypothetical protein